MSDDKPGEGSATVAPLVAGRDTTAEGRGQVLPFRKWTRATLASVATLFDTAGVDLRFDTALGALMLYAPPPWAATASPCETYPHPVKRIDELRAAQWIAELHSEEVSVVVVGDAMRLTGANPSRQIDSVQATVLAAAGTWDGAPRLDTDLATRLGLDDRTADKQISLARWYIATVRRMILPGVPLEDVLLVEEAQQLRAVVQMLATLVPPALVLDTSLNFDCRFGVAARRLVGKGLVLVSDATHHTVRELETLVSFAAMPHDGDDLPPRHAGFALVASGRRQEHIPARCVMTKVRRAPLPTDAETRRQWLAEAVARADAYVPEARTSLYRVKEHPWEVPIWTYLRKTSVRWVTTNTLLTECCKIPIDRREVRHHQAVGEILTKFGWTDGRVNADLTLAPADEVPRGGRREKRVRVWVPPPDFYDKATPTTLEPAKDTGQKEGDIPTSVADVLGRVPVGTEAGQTVTSPDMHPQIADPSKTAGGQTVTSPYTSLHDKESST